MSRKFLLAEEYIMYLDAIAYYGPLSSVSIMMCSQVADRDSERGWSRIPSIWD